MKISELPDEHKAALRKAREHFGKAWKQDLLMCWERASYPRAFNDDAGTDGMLQQIRNRCGPSALHRSRPADIGD